MLAGIRGAAGTWLGKLILTIMFGFLIISFAIWGIGDIFRGYGSNTLAKVGKTEIGIETYRRAFQQRIYEIQQRSRGFTAEQARAVGVDRQVLNQLVGEAALNEYSQRLGLAVSTEEVARSLALNSAFRGADGNFSRPTFDNYLREIGQNEAGFLQAQRLAALRQHLGEAISGGFVTPNAVLEMLHRYRSEERSLTYVVVPGAIATALPPPTDDQLKALHEQRKSAFRAPEYRKVALMVLSPSEFASDIKVSEAELRAAYDRGLAANRFGEPEKRQIQQIVFPNAAEAATAAERLKGGLTFEALVEERKLRPADIDIGLKSRAEVADRAIADAAFALPENTISQPVQGPFGTVLLRVTGIIPGSAQTFESMKDTLQADVTAARLTNDRDVRRKVDTMHDKIEELRAAGKSLDVVASELGRPLVAIDAIDAQGRDKAGAPVASIPDAADVLKAIYLSDRGVDNEAIRTRDNSYVWFEIRSIEPAREKSFDEVKTQVEEAWRNDEAVRLSSENASAYLKRLEAGETIETIASELGVSVETATGVTRNGKDAIGPSAAATAFALKPGAYAIAGAGRGADRMLLKVDSVSVPPFNVGDEAIATLKKQVDSTLSDEIMNQFASKIQTDVGVSVNERQLGLATGAQAQR